MAIKIPRQHVTYAQYALYYILLLCVSVQWSNYLLHTAVHNNVHGVYLPLAHCSWIHNIFLLLRSLNSIQHVSCNKSDVHSHTNTHSNHLLVWLFRCVYVYNSGTRYPAVHVYHYRNVIMYIPRADTSHCNVWFQFVSADNIMYVHLGSHPPPPLPPFRVPKLTIYAAEYIII